jgi:hypothetical protein
MPDSLCFHIRSEIHIKTKVIFTCKSYTIYIFKDDFMYGIHFSLDLKD